MATYIEMNINQRINYKGSQINKAKAYCTGRKNCIDIYISAWECTGDKPHDYVRTYSRNSRNHFN